jgi:two-component system CheB/CheR fusion protein
MNLGAPVGKATDSAFLICAVVVDSRQTQALCDLLEKLPPAAPVALIIVDAGQGATPPIDAKSLSQAAGRTVADCANGSALRPLGHAAPTKAGGANSKGGLYLLSQHSLLDFKGGKMLLEPIPLSSPHRQTAMGTTKTLNAIADHFGDRSVAVILNAPGGDAPLGVDTLLGMEAIASVGGLCLIQTTTPTAPEHDAPFAETVADSAAVVAALTGFARHLDTAGPLPTRIDASEIRAVCDVVRDATGHDFRHYKETTLSRRILRRINVLRCASVAEYVDELRQRPEEVKTIMRDLLIGVTSFFRDPDAFDSLRQNALLRLIDRDKTDPLRVWVPGCATGQEAYTIAIIASELLEETGSSQQVQVFATDLNERSLAVGRRAIYPDTIAEELGPERMERFFTRNGKRWQVNKHLRQMVVFSPHNLINDPPFSRMDLISCRNVMIYLGQHLQIKLMSVFHYALRSDGYLFLGSSEAVTGHGELFRAIDPRHRIAQRRDVGLQNNDLGRPASPALTSGWQAAIPHQGADIGAIAQRIVLDEFAPPYAIVNEHAQIVFLSARANTYLQAPSGQFVNNILRMTRPALRPGLRAAWTRAQKQRRIATHTILQVENDLRERVRITVQPMPELGEDEGRYMVVFQDLGPTSPAEESSPPQRPEAEGLVEQLEAELLRTRDDLERMVQDIEAANEELKSSNEELLSMNEELQSANEELETSKEEVERAADNLAAANADLVNLLESTQIATIFLDGSGCIRRFTPAATQLYNLSDRDHGRPLVHFTHNFQTSEGLQATDKPVEMRHRDGRVFLRRVTPYVMNDRVDGEVITFVDITDQHRVKSRLAASLSDIETIYQHTPVGLAQISANDLRIERINALMAQENNLPIADQIGRTMAEMVPDLADQMHERVAQIMATGTAIGPFEIHGKAGGRDTEQVWMQTWAPARDAQGNITSILISSTDITDRAAATAAIEETSTRVRKTMDQVLAFVGVLSPDGVLLEANEPAIAAAGVARDELIGKPFADCYWWAFDEASQTRLRNAVKLAAKGEVVRYDAPVRVHNDARIIIDFQLAPYFDEEGKIAYLIPSGVDITQRKAVETEQTNTLRSLELALDTGKLGVFSWDIIADVMDWSDYLFTTAGYAVGSIKPSYGLWAARVHPDDLPRVEAAIEKSRKTGKRFVQDYRFVQPDETIVHVEASGTFFYADGGATHMIGVVKDVSFVKRSEQRLHEIMATSQVGILLATRDGTLTQVNDAALDMLGLTNTAATGPTKSALSQDIAQMLLADGRAGPIEMTIMRPDDDDLPVLVSAAIIAASPNEFVAFLVDMSDQKRTNAHRDLLLGELNHRVKNSLAIIQAMAGQSLRSANSLADFKASFTGRLHAIALAHEILTSDDTGHVDLVDLIQRQVGPYTSTGETALKLHGPTLSLDPDSGHALGLILHELATNATKYGALGSPDGQVNIEWQVLTNDQGPVIQIIWQESGGPQVAAPTRKGFGTRLIETSLSHSLGGHAVLDFQPGGLKATLDIQQEAGHV